MGNVFRFLGRPPSATARLSRRRVSEKAQGLNRGMAAWRYGDLGAAGDPAERSRWLMKLGRQPLNAVGGAGRWGWSWAALTAGMVIRVQIPHAAQAVATSV